MSLASLGFDASFARELSALAVTEAFAGRVARVDADIAQLFVESGPTSARVPRRVVRGELGRPVTGDWVACVTRGELVIDAVLPRRSELVRRAAGRRQIPQRLAANVDVLFVIMGLDADFNPRRLERYLTLAAEGRIRPVVLLTKAGLVKNADALREQALAVSPGIDVHAIDVVDGISADAPRRYLGEGITAAVVGSSGAGKSTLVNHLLGEDHMRTGSVREHDDRGRHTTSHRELIRLACGGAIIDTPGLRELGLWADAGAVDTAFPDVVELASGCKYRDCLHGTEPGCGVQQAVVEGRLPATRLASYLALGRELSGKNRGARRDGR